MDELLRRTNLPRVTRLSIYYENLRQACQRMEVEQALAVILGQPSSLEPFAGRLHEG
jgi:hypothetical protein